MPLYDRVKNWESVRKIKTRDEIMESLKIKVNQRFDREEIIRYLRKIWDYQYLEEMSDNDIRVLQSMVNEGNNWRVGRDIVNRPDGVPHGRRWCTTIEYCGGKYEFMVYFAWVTLYAGTPYADIQLKHQVECSLPINGSGWMFMEYFHRIVRGIKPLVDYT